MNRYSTVIALLTILTAGLSSYAEDVTVELKPVTIEHPTTIMTPRDFLQKEGCPIVTYSGLIIPENRLGFSPQEKEKSFDLAGTKVTVTFDGRMGFGLKAGGKEIPLERKGYGLATTEVNLGGRKYALAFPRSITYAGHGAVWYRSGAVMAGKLGETDVCFYDADTDGKYSVENDVVKTAPPGKGDVFAPIREMVATKKGIFKLVKLAEDGTSAVFSPVEGEAVPVPMQYSTRETQYQCHAAMASEDGKLTFAVISGQTPALPLGKYKTLYGFIYDSRKNRVVWVWVPHKERLVEVKKDGRNPSVIPFGRPWGLEFSHGFACREGKIKIVIKSPVIIMGQLGEKFMGKAFSCEVSVGRSRRPHGAGSVTDQGDGLPADMEVNMPDLSRVQGMEKLTVHLKPTPAVVGWYGGLSKPFGSISQFADELITRLEKHEFKGRNAARERGDLLRTIGAASGDKALETLKKELESENADAKLAALQAFTAWTDPSAAETLLEIAEKYREDKKLGGTAERLILNCARDLLETQKDKAMGLLKELSEKAADGNVKKEAAAAVAALTPKEEKKK